MVRTRAAHLAGTASDAAFADHSITNREARDSRTESHHGGNPLVSRCQRKERLSGLEIDHRAVQQFKVGGAQADGDRRKEQLVVAWLAHANIEESVTPRTLDAQ